MENQVPIAPQAAVISEIFTAYRDDEFDYLVPSPDGSKAIPLAHILAQVELSDGTWKPLGMTFDKRFARRRVVISVFAMVTAESPAAQFFKQYQQMKEGIANAEIKKEGGGVQGAAPVQKGSGAGVDDSQGKNADRQSSDNR